MHVRLLPAACNVVEQLVIYLSLLYTYLFVAVRPS